MIFFSENLREGSLAFPLKFFFDAFLRLSNFEKAALFFAHDCPPSDQSEMEVFGVYVDAKLEISHPITTWGAF